MIQTPDFDAVYRDDPDPWQVASSFYEQRKLALVLACLTRARYASAWDPASGTGELAAKLAGRVDSVLATDGSPEAVQLTTRRCAAVSAVAVRHLSQPERPGWWRGAGFELIVVAEFAYYLSAEDRCAMWPVFSASAAPSAEMLLVHWRHRPHDGYLSGAEVQLEALESLTTSHDWFRVVHHDDQDFVLDVVRREGH